MLVGGSRMFVLWVTLYCLLQRSESIFFISKQSISTCNTVNTCARLESLTMLCFLQSSMESFNFLLAFIDMGKLPKCIAPVIERRIIPGLYLSGPDAYP